MGPLVAAALASLLACDDAKAPPAPPPPGTTRSDAVLATKPATPAMPTVGAQTAAHAPPAAPRKLCEGQLDKPGRPLPARALSHAQAPGAPVLPDTLGTGGNRWTWVNFWAAWCGPCKEEMPRLQAWERKLGGALSLAFISLDDDERQLREFLAAQPATGVRTSFWLPEGAARDAWRDAVLLPALSDALAHPDFAAWDALLDRLTYEEGDMDAFVAAGAAWRDGAADRAAARVAARAEREGD